MSRAAGVSRQHVVAVVATLAGGREQVGSGHLCGARRVVTAAHCLRDKATGQPAAGLRVVRANDGAVFSVRDFVASDRLDVAVVDLYENAAVDSSDFVPLPRFARVDRTHSGVLADCVAIGYPLFQRDPDARRRHTAELHGVIYQTDEAEAGLLLLRDPVLTTVSPPEGARSSRNSAWGGLSGAVVFHRGNAIGVIIEHHPRQGDAAVRVLPFDLIARTAAADNATRAITERLGMSPAAELPLTTGTDVLADLGTAIRSLVDPIEYEVHPVIPVPGRTDLPSVPAYVRREHDDRADAFLQPPFNGTHMLVFVGGSSTGKTRAAWEAVHRLPDGWVLWHPIEPSRPQALLDGLKTGVSPNTVVWLNELQLYLDPPEGLGERVASQLRGLLRRDSGGPLIVVGTLWPEHWAALTAGPERLAADRHSQARNLLRRATTIRVPETFMSVTGALHAAAATDPRLEQALRDGKGRIAQYLAGVRELVARYREATPVQLTLLAAAADAARIGSLTRVPEQWLVDTAEGYLSDDDWQLHAGDWPTEARAALRELARPRMGVQGPLSRVRDVGTGDRSSDEGRYALADYLARSIINSRRYECPPASFWDSVSRVVDNPAWLTTLADRAAARARYQHATTLYRAAIERGYAPAIAAFARLYRRRGRLVDAVATYRTAVDQGELWAISELADLFEEMGEPAEVERLAQWALEIISPVTVRNSPMRWEAVHKLTLGQASSWQPLTHQFIVDIVARRRDSGDEAGAELLQRLMADAGHGPALVDLMNGREATGDTDGAEELAGELLSKGNLDLAEHVTNLALERRRAGDIAGALRLYTSCAEAGDVGAVAELAGMHLLADEREEAQILIDQSDSRNLVELLAMGAALREELHARPDRSQPVAIGDNYPIPEAELRARDLGRERLEAAILQRITDKAAAGDLSAQLELVNRQPEDRGARDRVVAQLRSLGESGNAPALVLTLLLDPDDRQTLDLLINTQLEEIDPDAIAELAESQGEAGNADTAVHLYLLVLNAGHTSAFDGLVRWLRRGGWHDHANAAGAHGLNADGTVARR